MSLTYENLPTNEQFQEILKEKLQDLEKEVRDAKQLINLHKDWYKGSPQQQRSRKRSYKKNLEKLPILESKVNLMKNVLKEEKC
tara:strand:- start:1538 stop:1789 length:252 start_codon:yes stop_codon:yes gene_type:complete